MTNEYIQSTFQIRKLESDERIESFDCGDADLNDFILNESLVLSGSATGCELFLIDFIKAFFIFDNKTGCRFVTVDAYRSAIPFYEKNGFLPLLEEDDGEMTRLLYFDLADYKNSLQG